MLPPILLPHSGLNPLQSNFLLTIPLMAPVMLNLMANSQSSSYMTYISDCMSQFAQDNLGFACSPQMITNNILFHLKSIQFCTR